MRKVFNFNAGPAMVPEEVLLQAQKEMLDWHGTGMSLMEIGHRTPDFREIAEKAEQDLRDLMNIPKHYAVLFVPGGATTQFAMVPMNLFGNKKVADYIDTGIWSKKAIDEAKRYGNVNIAAKTHQEQHLLGVPPQATWQLSEDPAYVHYTPNETIDGIEFEWVPKTGDIPLVADMTSSILVRPVDVNDFGVIYAGAQKNIGQAGITIVIVRDDLLDDAFPFTPTLYKYKTHAEHHSLYNTPPTYSWYIAGLVLAWTKKQGGVQHFFEKSKRHSSRLYRIIDAHPEIYSSRIHPNSRSIMNVMFYMRDEKLTPFFLDQAVEHRLVNLRGHRVSGGIRASMYNAMPDEAIDILEDFMIDFAKKHG